MNDVRTPLLLVVDDEVNTTIMLQHIFAREGYQVESANDGFRALELARDLQPDLILLDILMPGINGFDVLVSLREDPVTANIPTIMLTANAREPADVAKGLKLGADDYLYKPFAPQELLARVQSKIRSHQLEMALQRRTQELEALLRVSDMLNEHLAVAELVQISLELVVELLPADLAVMYLLDGEEVVDVRSIARNGEATLPGLNLDSSVLERSIQASHTLHWTPANPVFTGFDSGFLQTLTQSGQRLAVIVVARKSGDFDGDQQRLFEGICRQTALALHNAKLYELQANYATTLEERVAERTRDLESAQRLLLRSEKLASIGHLAASIAHEINNPLMPIRNLLDDIFEELTQRGIDFDVQSMQIILDSLERIRGIVRRLLEFARDPQQELQLLDISGILDGIVKLNYKFFEHQHVQFETSLPVLPPVLGSKDQLEQVFMNLALNAQAAMESGGKLRVSARREGNQIVVEFADSGKGIPADQMEKIFDPFFSTKPNGTGLGLFVSHGIIQGHNGSIEVESAVGKGTTFIVRLPIHAQE